VAGEAYASDWRRRPARERGALLLECARAIRQRLDELGELETLEMGKPLLQAREFDCRTSADIFEYYGGLADKVPGASFAQGPVDSTTFHEPYGVIGAVIPFNWPPIHFAQKAAPALAAGNTMVLKPAEQAPLVVTRLAQLLADVLPPGVLNVVPGTGPDAGAALAGHPAIGKLTFTGSSETGKAIVRAGAESLTEAMLELGGKNALVIFEDADLDAALAAALEGMFFNQGEACTSASRMVVHESIHDRFVKRLVDAAGRLRVGDGMDPATDLGPMVDRRQQERVCSYVEIGKQEGATLAFEGQVPSDPRLRGGSFVPVVVFTDVAPGMRIAQEEIFGPVCSVLSFSTYEQAIEIANGTPYGLVAGAFTSDATLATRAAHDLEAGIVLINNYNRALLGTPFGGFKASGGGRELAVETLLAYTRTKNVRRPSGLGAIRRWPTVDRILGS
jgi:acyl-CoA reductase-like NAD-dependent aldehyde dehydrogenase